MSLRIRPTATVLTMLAGVTGGLLVAAAPAVAGVVGSVSFSVPGNTSWTVPAGVTGAVFTVDGGGGGSETTYLNKTTYGGKGGQATGFLVVTPGETISLTVGGAGQSVQGFYNTYVGGGAGGFGGGGAGGGGDDPGAGGGGASRVAVGTTSELVAAGGGGAAASWLYDQQSPGGDGGGANGHDGSLIDSESQYGPARGATQSQGGAAGLSTYNTGETAGSLIFGGHGGSDSPSDFAGFGGAGGGGGWYGGGGGGLSGGAGGSSYLSPDLLQSDTTAGVNSGNGSITIEYGSVDGAAIDQNPVPHATAGTAYSHTFIATGWPAPSFFPVGSTLPSGLALSADGVLSGTLTTAGTYDFTIGAYNAESFVSREVELVVDPAAAATLTAGVDSPTGGSGTVQSGGVAPLVASLTDAWGNPVAGSVQFDLPARTPWRFPDGTKSAISSLDGSGHAVADVVLGAHLGTFVATVTALGTGLAAVTDTVKVVPAPAGLDGGGTQPGGLIGKPYDDPLSVFGVPAPTLTLHDGALPPGLALSGYDISGTPTHAGTYAFTLRVDNHATSGPVDVPCTITISRTPTAAITGGGVNPGPSGLHDVPLPVTLSAPAAVPVTVHWQTRAGTATAPVDFLGAHGDLTIPAGAISGTVTVQVRGHTPGLGTLEFSVTLSAPVNARILSGGRTATCSIYYG